MNIRYRVELSQSERDELTVLLSGGRHPARKLKRARILLAADAGASDAEIATGVVVGGSTVSRTKRRFVEGNLELALSEAPRLRGRTQADRQARGSSGGNRLLGPARGPCPLDPGAAVGCDGQADRAREPVVRDAAPTPGGEQPEALAQGHVVYSQGRC